ncbi:MAG: FG-GAP-like repeat-containing protein, partial [Halobacteriovoraceae bacterium]|nr:FG-GAP-like repeat-containing protein [Halobacteriovoraceae bacterium]
VLREKQIYFNDRAYFGEALAVKDMNGDNIPDLVVGAPLEGYPEKTGAVYILLMDAHLNISEVVTFNEKSLYSFKIRLENYGHFGASVAIGDLNQDGFLDLAIGAPKDNGVDTPNKPSFNQGVVYVLYLDDSLNLLDKDRIDNFYLRNTDITLKNDDFFGSAVAIADMDGNQTLDLIIGASGDNGETGKFRGAVHILYFNSFQNLTRTSTLNDSNLPLRDFDYFGSSLSVFTTAIENGIGKLSLFAGATGDDGKKNKYLDKGAVYLFNRKLNR